MNEIVLFAFFFILLFFLVALGLIGLMAYFTSRREIRQRVAGLAEVGQTAAVGKTTEASQTLLDSILKSESVFIRSLFAGGPLLQFKKLVNQSGSSQTPLFWLSLVMALGALAVVISLLTSPPWLISLALTALSCLAPIGFLALQRHRRLRAFERQFPESLGVLARAVRAGYAFTTGLKLIADEMPEPVSSEFRRTFEEQNLGLPMQDVLLNFADRVPSADVRIFVSSLQIQHEVGGNLAELLDNLAGVIRERFRLLRQIQIFAAEGKLSMYILMAFPPFLGVVFFFLNRQYIERLFSDPLGQRMLALAVFLQFIGYLVIRRLVNLKF